VHHINGVTYLLTKTECVIIQFNTALSTQNITSEKSLNTQSDTTVLVLGDDTLRNYLAAMNHFSTHLCS